MPWLALVALMLLSRPFHGFFQDAHLYMAQTLRYLGNGELDKDIFFVFGNQDDFTVFTSIYAPLVQALGASKANMVAYGVGLLFWFGALVFLSRVLFEGRDARILAVLGAVALSPAYGSGVLSYAEGFVTPRIFAEAFGLLSIAALLRNRYLASAATAAAALLMHPLLGLVIVALLVWVVIRGIRMYLTVCCLGLLVIAGLGWLGVMPFAWVWERMDPEWYAMIKAHSALVFPTSWDAAGYAIVPLKLLIAAIIVTRDIGVRRELAEGILIVGGILVALSIVLADILGSRLFVALQLWRVLFLLSLVGNMMAFRALALIPAGQSITFLSLAIGVNFFEAALGLSSVLSAGLAITAVGVLMCEKQGAERLGRIAQLVGWVVLAIVLASVATVVATKLQDPAGEAKIVMLILYLCAIAAAFTSWQTGAKAYLGALLAVIALTGSALAIDKRSQWEKYNESSDPPPSEVLNRVADKTVYWEDGLPLLWFKFRIPQYYSCRQKAGSVFFRDQAYEFFRRAETLSQLNSLDFPSSNRSGCPTKAQPNQDGPIGRHQLEYVCTALNELDLVVLRARLPGLYRHVWRSPMVLDLPVAGEPKQKALVPYFFYHCADFRP